MLPRFPIPWRNNLKEIERMTEITHLRTIRSFVLREGRMTEGQKKAIANHWPIFGLEREQGLLNFEQVFGRNAPTILEIGFGMGQSLLEQALAHPERNYIGIEVHRPGIGTLLKAMAENNVQNVRLYNDDGVAVLKECIGDQSLTGFQLFFPDPWHKKRHHKRRIVQNEFVQLVRQKLSLGGLFHLATDWQNYAEHMMELMEVAPGFKNKFGAKAFAKDTFGRPHTKFEARGQRLGHGVWDLVYERVS